MRRITLVVNVVAAMVILLVIVAAALMGLLFAMSVASFSGRWREEFGKMSNVKQSNAVQQCAID